jgi:hypothetical protein
MSPFYLLEEVSARRRSLEVRIMLSLIKSASPNFNIAYLIVSTMTQGLR